MDSFEKLAEIRAKDGKTAKRIIKILENNGLSVCCDFNCGLDPCDFVVMEKEVPDKNLVL